MGKNKERNGRIADFAAKWDALMNFLIKIIIAVVPHGPLLLSLFFSLSLSSINTDVRPYCRTTCKYNAKTVLRRTCSQDIRFLSIPGFRRRSQLAGYTCDTVTHRWIPIDQGEYRELLRARTCFDPCYTRCTLITSLKLPIDTPLVRSLSFSLSADKKRSKR